MRRKCLPASRARPGRDTPRSYPNLTGLERAHAAGVGEVGIFAAASETFSRKNINQPIDASLEIYRAVCARASELGIRVRGYVSTAFGCPFEGEVPVSRVADVAAALFTMGAFEVAISDTIGIAHPGQVPRVVGAVADRIPMDAIALHFHDTRGTALANVLTALNLGVATFDASAGGLGGCPYAPRCDRQSGDRRSGLHARRPGHGERCRPAGARRRVRLHRAAGRTSAAVALLQGREETLNVRMTDRRSAGSGKLEAGS